MHRLAVGVGHFSTWLARPATGRSAHVCLVFQSIISRIIVFRGGEAETNMPLVGRYIYATVGLTPGERRQIGFGTMNPIRHHRLAKDARQANTRTTGISQTWRYRNIFNLCYATLASCTGLTLVQKVAFGQVFNWKKSNQKSISASHTKNWILPKHWQNLHTNPQNIR